MHIYMKTAAREFVSQAVFQNSPDCVAVENRFSLTLWSVHAVFIFQGETPAIN